ncbi:MAG: hypothetical protein NTY38_28295, partial [Acidobacteria bacterium]|nr:hypothetical protein [Acidobacteriota bacterium]
MKIPIAQKANPVEVSGDEMLFLGMLLLACEHAAGAGLKPALRPARNGVVGEINALNRCGIINNGGGAPEL